MNAEHLAVGDVLEHRDPIADLAVGHARAQGRHDADRIDAADMRQLHVALRLLAGAHGDVEHAVDRTGANIEHDLARARNRIGHVFVMQHLGRAEFPVDHRLHRNAPPKN